MKKSSKTILEKIIRSVAQTRPDEIGCDSCFEYMNEFADMEQNKILQENAMPLVKDHLLNCNDCQEEYKALLNAMNAIQK